MNPLLGSSINSKMKSLKLSPPEVTKNAKNPEMRVFIFQSAYSEAGGESVSVRILVDALRAAGVEVKFYEVRNSELLSSGTSTASGPVIFRTRVVAEDIRSLLEDFRPSVIHLENSFPFMGPAIMQVIGAENLPWLQVIRNYRETCIAGTHFRGGRNCFSCLKRPLSVPAVYHGCLHSSSAKTVLGLASRKITEIRRNKNPPSATVFTSRFLETFYSGSRYPSPITIGNPVKFDSSLEAVATNERVWDFSFVGRLVAEKGIHLILHLARQNPLKSFRIVGRGPLTSEVASEAEQLANLTFQGAIAEHQTAQVFRQTRFLLVPSVWNEPFGRVVVEAIANGAIPIVSKHGGLGDFISDLGASFPVVEGDTTHDWQAKIEFLEGLRPEARQLLQSSLFESAKRAFEARIIAQRFINLYRTIAN